MSDLSPARSPSWKWWVCGLLLLATTVNYMDRLTLNLQTTTIMHAVGFDTHTEDGKREAAAAYGLLEAAFGSAFALGAIVMGYLADRINVRWLYAGAVLLWSMAGLATGLVQGFMALLFCRFALGFAEAGNWPSALRTTQHILPPAQRTLGNSILQSGAAIGAILTPLLIRWMTPANWQWTFILVGLLGFAWAALWLTSVRTADLEMDHPPASRSLMEIVGWIVGLLAFDAVIHVTAAGVVIPGIGFGDISVPLLSKAVTTIAGILVVSRWLFLATADDDTLPRSLFLRRFLALATTVVAINITWHFFRAWLSPFLQHVHGYTEQGAIDFALFYYLATDAGSLTAGFLVLALAAPLGVHGSRVVVYAGFAVLALATFLAARLPANGSLEVVLLVIGFASLGLFPIYYALSQEVTRKNQGKLTGALGCICWLMMSLLQETVGESVRQTGSYSTGVALAGVAPLIGLVALLALWGKTPEPSSVSPPVPALEPQPTG
jgi:ACS family hexuronate transporter-like MFS transporter